MVPVPAVAAPVRDSQWHLKFLNVAEAHKHSQGEGVVVGVVDTGVDATHPDLAGSVLPGKDLSGGTSGDGRQDIDGHGTSMAGLVAAHGSALGVAPKARILPVRKGLDRVGFGFAEASIDWAVDNGAKVLCLAFVTHDRRELRAAIDRAMKADVVVVAGVGNTNEDLGKRFPAGYDGVLAAAGVDRQGNHAGISVTTPFAVLAAPAVGIISTGLQKKYVIGEGTSGSTAIVAGAAALVRARYPNLSAREVIRRLTATADDKGAPGRDQEYGYGVLNLVKALTADVPSAESPTPTAAAPTIATRAARHSSFPSRTVLIGALILLVLAAAGGAIALVAARHRR